VLTLLLWFAGLWVLQENDSLVANVADGGGGGGGGAEVVRGEQLFSSVIHTLPALYPEHRLRELSVPFCFICLLHLANEKNLAIDGSGDLGDLRVRQNGPPVLGTIHA
jgi:hypothetical protein